LQNAGKEGKLNNVESKMHCFCKPSVQAKYWRSIKF